MRRKIHKMKSSKKKTIKSFVTAHFFFAPVLILVGILGSFGNIREIFAAEPFFIEGNIYTDEGTTLDTTSSRTISLRMATGTPVIMSTTTVDNGFFKFELGVICITETLQLQIKKCP